MRLIPMISKRRQGLRSIININHSNSPKITQNVNGKLLNNPDKIAEKVNEDFVNIGLQTEKCIPKVLNLTPNKFP